MSLEKGAFATCNIDWQTLTDDLLFFYNFENLELKVISQPAIHSLLIDS
jgi:hypothetical protein